MTERLSERGRLIEQLNNHFIGEINGGYVEGKKYLFTIDEIADFILADRASTKGEIAKQVKQDFLDWHLSEVARLKTEWEKEYIHKQDARYGESVAYFKGGE